MDSSQCRRPTRLDLGDSSQRHRVHAITQARSGLVRRGRRGPGWASQVLQTVFDALRKRRPIKEVGNHILLYGLGEMTAQPVPDSNFFARIEKGRFSQQKAGNRFPARKGCTISEPEGAFCPCLPGLRWYSSSLSCARHSASVLTTLRSGAGFAALRQIQNIGPT